jgi:hypothetical protein
MDEEIEQDGNLKNKEDTSVQEAITFLQAIYKLNLPQRMDVTQGGKKDKLKMVGMPGKKQSLTNFDPMNAFHMVQVIELSNFKNRGFCTSALKELLDSTSEMRCLHKLVLSNNGIGNAQSTQLTQIFKNSHLTHLDLSGNELDKQCASIIGELMKEEVSHLQWLE